MDLWYAGYGSNLLRSRFHSYLTGGPTPGSPAQTVEAGALDPTLPSAEWTGQVELAARFAGTSRRWGGGGFGFVVHGQPSRPTWVRAYRITTGQFVDLHRQENRSTDRAEFDLSDLVDHGGLDLHPGSTYPRALVCGTHPDGRPIVVVAGNESPPLRAPHESYLRVMAAGLCDGFELTDDEIASYLCAWPGAHGAVTPQEVLAILDGLTQDRPG